MPITTSQNAAIELLVDRLRTHFGPRLSNTFLFGSKARGDDGPDSDIDVLVVLENDIIEEERAAVSSTVYDVLEATGIFIQTVTLSRNEFEHPKGRLRWLTSFVREDGRAL